MGFLDFLFKSKTELHEDKPTCECNCKERTYTDKGITKKQNKQGESWIAQLYIARGSKKESVQIYIGSYDTKEQAQKARWEFIENLK